MPQGVLSCSRAIASLHWPKRVHHSPIPFSREHWRSHTAASLRVSCGLQVTIVAESFGGCLGLRVAAAAPELVERLVLVNPATSFARALGGLPGVIAGTNLLSLFPEPLYQVRPGCHQMPVMPGMLCLGPAVTRLPRRSCGMKWIGGCSKCCECAPTEIAMLGVAVVSSDSAHAAGASSAGASPR